MTLSSALYTFFLMPLQILFEFIYSIAYRFINNPGLSIIALSLAINLLVLPLYRRADSIQEEEHQIELKLQDGAAHIKKTFRGDEKTMMLQTYYRQNNYSPTRVFRGSVSLLLQIPFFIAAYRFLSGLELLQGVAFGPIADLGQPDALLVLGNMSINLLPFIMTGINVISSVLFTKGQPLKSKIQLYALAAFFLVFLYNSPAGLVFYWTLNNLFSLIKTIFYKLKEPKKVLRILSLTVGGFCFLLGIISFESNGYIKRLLFFTAMGIILCLPMVCTIIKKKSPVKPSIFALKGLSPDKKFFFTTGLLLSVLIGILIPSAVINASPQEFVDLTYFVHPIWYIVSAFLLSTGTFVLWMGIFYWLASEKSKVVFESILFICSGAALVNYFFFGKNLGVLSSSLKYETGLVFDNIEILMNLWVVLFLSAILFFVVKKWKRQLRKVVLITVIALCFMSGLNISQTCQSIAEIKAEDSSYPSFTLSRTGQNVVVIMLDRAMGEYVPYLFNEKSELQTQFSGFTYYSNVVSFGSATNFATPALFGGYEYTPANINAKTEQSLAEKQNEALKVMPVIFDEAGYDVTVCDPPYAGYQWVPDLSIFDDYPDISTYNTNGYFTGVENKEEKVNKRFRNFFCFGITKILPLCVQSPVYNLGRYNNSTTLALSASSEGVSNDFLTGYNVLQNLSNMTMISENEQGGCLILTNDITHNAGLLQEPDYTPSSSVDNTEYDAAHTDRFTLNGVTLHMDTEEDLALYQTNMAAMIQLGKWFDYLKEQGVYDNTRIILVSDHGWPVYEMDELTIESVPELYDEALDAELYFPLLMVKDFYSEGFTTVDELMTNADVPTLAVQHLIEDARNPFTQNLISNEEKNHPLLLIRSNDYDIDVNNGNTFLPARWYTVKDSIWDKNNWSMVADEAILAE